MMDLVTIGIFVACFLVVLSLVGLLSFLTKEESYEDGLRKQKGGRLERLGVNKSKGDETGGGGKNKRQAKQNQGQKASKKHDKQVHSQAVKEEVSEPDAAPVAPTPVVEEIPAPKEQGVHMTAAGKAAAAAKAAVSSTGLKSADPAPSKPNKMVIEEIESPDVVDEVAEIEQVDNRVPVSEPVVVKEEANLLFEDKLQGSGTGTSTPTAQHSTPISGNRQKKKQKGGGQQQQQSAASLQPQDLMTAVRKTNFDNEELQDLIDILLNKQQNSPMVQNGSWVDPQTNEMKQLQRALEESGKALEFEQAKVKDMSGRFQQMQRDLGESKGQMARLRSDYTERINGMERAKMEVDQNLATLSHRHNYDVQNLTHQIQEQMRQISDLNGHLAAFRNRPDPDSVRAELEQAHSNELNNLHSQLSMRTNELASMKQQVQELRSKVEGSDAMLMELNKAKEQAKSLETQCSVLQQECNNQMLQNQNQDNSKHAELQSTIDELVKSKGSLEQSLTEVSSKLKSSDEQLMATQAELSQRVAQLEEEKKNLVEEKKQQQVVNGDHEKPSPADEEAAAKKKEAEEELYTRMQNKLNEVVKEKEALMQKINNDQEQLQSRVAEADSLKGELESVKGQLSDANVKLEQQRAKNDELRVKNWKAVDALKKAEEGLEAATKKASKKVQPASPTSSSLDEKTSSAKEAAEKYVSFLTRVFADVDFTSEESVWKSGVEAHIEALKSKVTEAAEAAAAAASKQTEAAAAEADESSKSSEEIERLEKQVTHYKSSLQETEALLHKLQASVEAEEAKWKQSLSDQQAELDALKEQNAKMETCVQSAEEMQEKLQQLQSQLIGHEAAKKDLEKSLADKIDSESEEKQKLMQEIECLKEGKSELGLQVARMNQLVTAGQEALQQEQKTADLLREQLAKVKGSVDSNLAESTTTNNEVLTS